MGRFLVSAPGVRPATVEAGNWLAALGLGLDKLGLDADFSRLACELLPNGTVIAQDVRSGNRFVVRPESEETAPARLGNETPTQPRSKDSPRFKEATAAELGFGDTGEPSSPEEADTFVPDDDGEDDHLYTESDDDIEPLTEAEDNSEEEFAADEDSATPVIIDDPNDLHGVEEDTDEEEIIAEEGSRTTEPLPPGHIEPFPDDDDNDTEEQEVLDLLEGVRLAPSDLVAWQNALDVSMKLVPSEAGSALQQEEGKGIRFVGTRGPNSHRLAGVILPRGIGIIGFCMERIASLIVQDPKNDPRFFRDMDQATGFATRAVLCVPVAMEGEVYGCLELMNPPEGILFNRNHIELVEMVAAALADRLATGRAP